MAACVGWMRKLIRKKVFTDEEMNTSDLRRCLTTLDLIGLGTGSTLGAGAYILSGQVAKDTAGPAVVVSFLVAGLAAALAGLCYAEFAARVPRAGSAYIYSYVTVGELMAFVVGWNILLEYIISVASVARALSAYLDFMLGNKMQNFFLQYMPMSAPGIATYPDFFAFFLVMLLTVLVALGVKESVRVTTAMTVINIIILCFIIISGFFKADLSNWQITGEELPESGAGTGGFTPFGFSGVMAGAATCFFAYVGFDFIATMGEEAENSRWSIPVSMGVTLLINIVMNCGVSSVITLMAPYFLLDPNAPAAFVFDYVGWDSAQYVVSVGALCGMSSSLMGAMFPLARVLYSMASDGLVFRCLSAVSPRFRTPLVGTVVCGVFSGLLTLFLDLAELVDMLSIGTLLAFTLVALCVLILRYKTEDDDDAAMSSGTVADTPHSPVNLNNILKPCSSTPTPGTALIVQTCLVIMFVFLTAFSAFTTLEQEMSTWSIAVSVVLATVALAPVVVISCQPQRPTHLNFKVPLVPLIPVMSCIVNIYLMFKLSTITWIRFVVWLFIGFSIYFFYGVRHSDLNDTTGERTRLYVPESNGSQAAASQGLCPRQPNQHLDKGHRPITQLPDSAHLTAHNSEIGKNALR